MRIVITPLVAVLIWSDVAPHGYQFALYLYTIASVTDYIDGFIARRLKVESPFGEMLDPIADKLLTKEECNRSEFCQWDDEAQKCKGLSIDYAVRKMSIMRAKLNQRFLDMLQVSAVDCLVFRELHDDRSRQCFVPDKNSTTADVRAYRGFNEADYEETEETVQKQTRTVKASNATKTLKCRILKTEAECAANDACYIERGKFYGFK